MISHAWNIIRPHRPAFDGLYNLSVHATSRMFGRSFSPQAIEKALTYGEPVYDRGGLIFRIGKKQIKQCQNFGEDLSDLEGLHIVCSPDGHILTVYRNRDFRTLRKSHAPRPRSRSRRAFSPSF